MRLFETLLLITNVLALISSVRKPSKSAWHIVIASNLLVLLLHLLFEGCRYQLAFAYVFVVLMVVNAFLKIRVNKVITANTTVFSVIFLGLAAFFAAALPVFTLPRPTGNLAVGIKYFPLIDEHRADPFLTDSSRKRELMVKIYYPARQDDLKPYSPYFHGSSALIHAWAEFYQMPRFLFDHFALVRTHSKDNLEVSAQQPSYPVVLFSNGAGTSMEVETSQSEDLASHGYIVVAIDHPFVSAATVFPDRVVTAREATKNFDTPEPAAPITQIMADDDAFVRRKLEEMNHGDLDPAFKGKLNLNQLGIIGHSVGGAVAYNMAINDKRVKAAINLDGTVYIIPKEIQQIAPLLMLANDKYHTQAILKRVSLMPKIEANPAGLQEMRDFYGGQKAYDSAYRTAQQNIAGLANVLKASGNLYTIEGSDHMKFTDMGLFIGSKWLRELMQIGGKTDPGRCLEITEALTLAFFDHCLKGESNATLLSLPKRYPELKNIKLQ